ncbi:unnamed protein product [Brachionus calyciflorus]|uniref:Malic enzyme n=1 Tax=Brachionus calyciflorus TaxID=104777 RepID=A0A814M927_9BILA|nr:unnamed protein product [Brachionus calyciflorus]
MLQIKPSNLKLIQKAINVQYFKFIKNIAVDDKEKISKPRSQIKGIDLIRNPSLYKGMAFTIEERQILGIHGLIPPAVLSQEVQSFRIMENFRRENDDLDRYISLTNLQYRNEKLFYKVLMDNLELLMPIIYTPTVGLACQKYGVSFRRAAGLFISIYDKGHIYDVLCNWPESTVKAIVVTDGERILGLGDLGCNGMGIPIGKLSLYTALAGIDPTHCLPIMLDVGTNNQTLLDDPLYIGLREKRIDGKIYEDFMDEFMDAVVARFGYYCLIQFEDFATKNAYKFLNKYRNKYCMFNDDIQGTAAVALAGIFTSLRVTDIRLEDNIFLFVGAGQASCGIADLLARAISSEADINFEKACEKIFMFDVDGLLIEERTEGNLKGPKFQFVKKNFRPTRDLTDAIEQIKPTALIGATGAGGIFTDSVLKKMAEINERPIIFALSNPTDLAECTAEQAYKNTDGRCLFSSGSPFEPVNYNGKTFIPGQGNNSYIFPGVALATTVFQSKHIDEEVFLIAAKSLSDQVTDENIAEGRIYPPMKKIHDVSVKIATEISKYYYKADVATLYPVPEDLESYIRDQLYDTTYQSYVPNTWKWPEQHMIPKQFNKFVK